LILYKSPAIIADIATGYVIYRIVKSLKGEKLALLSSAFYLFNPAVIANSTLWGQVDAITALFSILAVWLVDKKLILSAVFLAVGTAVKPQAALAAAAVLFVMLKQRWKLEKIALYVLSSLVVFVLLFVPFSLESENIPLFVIERVNTTLDQYAYTSVNAFSSWGLFGFWQKDTFGTQAIGFALIGVFSLIAAKGLWKQKGGRYLLLTIIFAAGFLFSTRMHERHLLPVLAPLAIAAAVEPLLWVSYIVLSFTYLINLRYSFVWINEDFREIVTGVWIKVLVLMNLASFALVFAAGIASYRVTDISNRLKKSLVKSRRREWKPKELFTKQTAGYLLIGILAFSVVTRLIFLVNPKEEYFDEVYHAFTARRMLHNDPKAWEWWNPHPEGFAYEWTHPPLAKEGMVLGMIVFGENAFGWRIVGALLGTASVYLVYAVAKELFKNESIGVVSAAVFALEGLPVVMSRIAMNDVYILFFALLSFYLFLKDKYLFSALAFGLAASSKWSAIWAVPIFIAAFFALKKKFRPSMLWFLVLPPLVYIATYTPMFLTGHGFDIFTGVQKQMWWYHTNLDATHPFTSAWWSWPILMRPIWLYTSGEIGQKVSNIYAMGNPVIFWTGLASILIAGYIALVERSKTLGLVVFSYLVFFVPWAMSPRIMFLYHYLPSIPFMTIALGYVLVRYVRVKIIVGFLTFALVVFIYFYPRYSGMSVPLQLDESFHWFNSW
jgi:predicted membrane-bound dolichyl-phosphate-mannose-protein mannosyltransferase